MERRLSRSVRDSGLWLVTVPSSRSVVSTYLALLGNTWKVESSVFFMPWRDSFNLYSGGRQTFWSESFIE